MDRSDWSRWIVGVGLLVVVLVVCGESATQTSGRSQPTQMEETTWSDANSVPGLRHAVARLRERIDVPILVPSKVPPRNDARLSASPPFLSTWCRTDRCSPLRLWSAEASLCRLWARHLRRLRRRSSEARQGRREAGAPLSLQSYFPTCRLTGLEVRLYRVTTALLLAKGRVVRLRYHLLTINAPAKSFSPHLVLWQFCATHR
jgi:hypothetical protein